MRDDAPTALDELRDAADEQERDDAYRREHGPSLTRRAFSTGLGAVSVAALGGAVAIGMGWWNPFPVRQSDADDTAAAITGDDTALDGRDGDPRDLTGRKMKPENDGEDSWHPEMDIVADLSELGPAFDKSDGRFRVPAVGMDVPLNIMSAVERGGEMVATPPGYRSVYLLRSFGTGMQDPENGTLYAITHSAYWAWGPGNYLVDNNGGAPLMPIGSEIIVSGVRYRFSDWENIGKKALSTHQPLWRDEPGRVAIITCRRIGGARTTENTVLYGEFVADAWS